MKVLLDTNALLWAMLANASLSKIAAEIIQDEGNIILVSAASAWEIATKVRIGKLPGAEAFENRFLDAISDAGYVLIGIEVVHTLHAGRLVGKHKDPFDRIIAAQAIMLGIPVISSDAKLDYFGVRRIW